MFQISWAMGKIQPTTFNSKALPCQEIEEVDNMEGEEEEPVVDPSEEEEENNHLDSPTETLPGLPGPNVEASCGSGGNSLSIKKTPASDLRAVYWDFIHDAQKLKKENPDLNGREVLKLAREEILGCKLISENCQVTPTSLCITVAHKGVTYWLNNWMTKEIYNQTK